MWFVMIEWDGKKPSGTYYARMRKLGLSVGRDSEKTGTPMERRIDQEKFGTLDVYGDRPDLTKVGVVFQEGAILCSSESLARDVMALATEYGASHVIICSGHQVSSTLTASDARRLSQLEGKLGTRGRPPADATKDWTVTCLEEGITTEVKDELYVVNCPYCMGTSVRCIPGERPSFKIPDGGDILESWVRHRFGRDGMFIVPETSGDRLPPSIETIEIKDLDERRAISAIKSTPELIDDFHKIEDKFGRAAAFRFIDGVMLTVAYATSNARQESRVQLCMTLYKKGFSATDAEILIPSKPDLIDAATVLDTDKVAGVFEDIRKI